MWIQNLFAGYPLVSNEEIADVLAQNSQVRIERIVSYGQASPPDFWYDQDQNEWVIVLSGNAELQLFDVEQSLKLSPGDHVLIPAHRKHRVTSTDQNVPTIWLAVFYGEDD